MTEKKAPINRDFGVSNQELSDCTFYHLITYMIQFLRHLHVEIYRLHFHATDKHTGWWEV